MTRPTALRNSRTPTSLIQRIGRVLFWVTATLTSLLTFPSAIPAMLAFWIALFTWSALGGKRSWHLLVVVVVLLIVKRPWVNAGLIAIGGACILLLIELYPNVKTDEGKRKHDKRRIAIACGILWLAWTGFAVQYYLGSTNNHIAKFDAERPVVCLGDSLTDYGYPQILKDRLAVPVEDFGFNGYATEDGIKLLPRIEALKPLAVVLELGGHDYNQGKPQHETKKRLVEIIERCQDVGAEVIIVEIPRGFITDPFTGMERSLAWRFDLELISDSMIRRFVFFSPLVPPGSWLSEDYHYSKDALHPNARGNHLIVDNVCKALRNVFGEEVLNSQ